MKKIFLICFVLIGLVAQAQGPVQYGPPVTTATGNITILNSNPLTGTPTAGSFVPIVLSNHTSASVNVSGTFTGALTGQYSTDGGTTWITISNAQAFTLMTTAAQTATIASAGVGAYKIDVTAMTNFRITALAAVTGTAVVTIKAVSSTSLIQLNAPLPTGTNSLGNLGTVTLLSGTTTLTPGSATANLGKIVGGTPGVDVGVAPLLSATSAQPVAGTTGKYAVPISNLYGAPVVYQFEKMVTSYSSAGVVTATATTASDVATITGSATKTVYITKILVSGSATVAFTAPVLILKRSTANSGTSTSSTVVPNDANDASGTATVVSYLANPTPGTLVGNVSASTLDFTTATGAPGGTVVFDYGERNKPIILRGTSQVLAINLNGTSPAGSLYFTFYWYEL